MLENKNQNYPIFYILFGNLINNFLYYEVLTKIGITYRHYNKSVVLISNGFAAKRTFDKIRDSILLSLASGQKTINQISGETDINWKTVERHLIYLIGRGWVREAFSSAYLRVFELTAFGKGYVRKNMPKNVRISDDKIFRINGDYNQ